MSDENKRIVRDFFDLCWNQNKPDEAIAQYRDPNCISHGLAAADLRGLAAYRAFLEVARNRFKETRIVVHDTIAEGDKVAFRASLHAKIDGKPVTLHGFGQVRIDQGKIVEAYNGWDTLGLLAQWKGHTASLEEALR